MHIYMFVFFLHQTCKRVKDNKTFQNDNLNLHTKTTKYLMLFIKIIVVVSSCNSQF